MATKVTLRPALGTLVFQETALSITPVEIATASQTYYHYEFDNTANSAVTYYKFYNVGSTPDPTDGATQPYVVVAVAATTKSYMFVPTGLTQGTGNYVIATSTQANATTQVAPTTAAGIAILG